MLLPFQTIQILSVLFTLIKGICNHVGNAPMNTCYLKSSELSINRKCLNATHWVEEEYATPNCSGQVTYSSINLCEKCNCNASIDGCKTVTQTITAETVTGINTWTSFDIIIDECFIDKHDRTPVSSYKLSCVYNTIPSVYRGIDFGYPYIESTYYMNSSNCTGQSIDLYASNSVAWNCSAQTPDNENIEKCTHIGDYATDYWQNYSTNYSTVYGFSDQYSWKHVCVDEYHYKKITVNDLDHPYEGGTIICNISDGCNCKGSIKNCHLATYEYTAYESCPHIQSHHNGVYVLNICVDVSDRKGYLGYKHGSQKIVCSEDNRIKTIYYSDTNCMDEVKYSVRVDGCGTGASLDPLSTTYKTVTTMVSSSDTLDLRNNRQNHRTVDIIIIISVSLGVILCLIITFVKVFHRKQKLYMHMLMMTNETDEMK